MKRKLRLLLAVVLAMTMVLGMGITVFAATPAGNSNDECSCTSHAGATHAYSFGTTFHLDSGNPSYPEGDYVNLYLYCVGDVPGKRDESHYLADNEFMVTTYGYSFPLFDPACFPDGYSEGWYYNISTDDFVFVPCDGHGGSNPDPGPTPTPTPTPPAGPSSPAHTHNFQWQTITAPTTDADGLEGEVCTICRATRNTQSLSAYGYALNDYATPMINAAKSGQTITFEFGEWNSFPKSFMEKLVNKSANGVTFVFHYKWNHVKQEITIPAGTPIDLNFDYYGPAKMAELYGIY